MNAMYYDPKVSYKNDLKFNFMNFMEKVINGPQREKMYLLTIISVLEKQSYAECMMFLESVTLYLTRLFHLFCEL